MYCCIYLDLTCFNLKLKKACHCLSVRAVLLFYFNIKSEGIVSRRTEYELCRVWFKVMYIHDLLVNERGNNIFNLLQNILWDGDFFFNSALKLVLSSRQPGRSVENFEHQFSYTCIIYIGISTLTGTKQRNVNCTSVMLPDTCTRTTIF